MKASETSNKYAGKVRECCNYAARTTKTYATGKDNDKRQPCGSDEKTLALNLKGDLNKFTDIVTEETFTAKQSAYILSNLLLFVFMALAAAAGICTSFFDPYALIILIIGIVFTVLSLLAFFGAFGGTSKSVSGTNIFAKRSPEGDVKKRFIIEANLDAPFKRTFSPKTVRILKLLTILGVVLYFVFDIVSLLIINGELKFFASVYFIYLSFPLALFAFIPLFLSRSVNANASFPGVVDNLVGCYTATGALRYLSEMDLRLKNTEVCVLLTGAKNAGLSGAKTYVKLHNEADAKIDTTILSLDTIYNPDTISVLSSSKKTGDIVEKAAKAADVKLHNTAPKYIKKNGSMKIFKKNKYECATITSLENVSPSYLGTSKDDESNINVKAIESVMKIVLETAYAIDNK